MNSFEAPISRWQEVIRPEWIDYNGHMNVAYYTLIFNNATDIFYPLMGIGKPYRDKTGKSTAAVDCHVTYQREALLGDEVSVTTQLLGFDEKRVHYFHAMFHVKEGFQIATLEQLALHVDVSGSKAKVEPFPKDVYEKISKMAEAHSILPTPKEVGRSVRNIGMGNI